MDTLSISGLIYVTNSESRPGINKISADTLSRQRRRGNRDLGRMEGSCHSTDGSSSRTVTTAASPGRDNPYLKHLSASTGSLARSPSPPALPLRPRPSAGNLHRPPVYSVNKSDFRKVVHSPAHGRLPSPPPIQARKLTSSRVQWIRPPPPPHAAFAPARLPCQTPPPSSSRIRALSLTIRFKSTSRLCPSVMSARTAASPMDSTRSGGQ